MNIKQKYYICKVLKWLKKCYLEKVFQKISIFDYESNYKFNLTRDNKTFKNFTFDIDCEFRTSPDEYYLDGPIYYNIIILFITIKIGEIKYRYHLEHYVDNFIEVSEKIKSQEWFNNQFRKKILCTECKFSNESYDIKYDICYYCSLVIFRKTIIENLKLDKRFYSDIISIISRLI
jgi:hypothetical protein